MPKDPLSQIPEETRPDGSPDIPQALTAAARLVIGVVMLLVALIVAAAAIVFSRQY